MQGTGTPGKLLVRYGVKRLSRSLTVNGQVSNCSCMPLVLGEQTGPEVMDIDGVPGLGMLTVLYAWHCERSAG